MVYNYSNKRRCPTLVNDTLRYHNLITNVAIGWGIVRLIAELEPITEIKMGLNCSHGAFDGAYSAFHRFRGAVCSAAGGVWDTEGRWEIPEEIYNKNDGLVELLNHSDCDGEITPQMCLKVADDLEKLLPIIDANDSCGVGHIARDGGFGAVTRKFIAGCREAAKLGEPLGFS